MCCGLAFPRNYLHIIIITLHTNTSTLLTDWVKLSKYEHVTYRLRQTEHVTYRLGQTEHVQTPQSSDQLLTTLCPPLLRKELQLYT